MRYRPFIVSALALALAAMLVLPSWAQEAGAAGDEDRFSKEELAQMLAPIALYPDSLIAQILMASTYPLEVVEAERWLRGKRHLEGKKLDEALRGKNWDPSVKSLCHFPDILFALSEKLDQTRTLGDAFLAQEDDVMDEIQELRRRADEQGNLRSTAEQKVIVEREIVRIEPANPQVVYVPVYDPYYVYGPWWYPSYPPYYWYYPSSYVITGGPLYFGPRFFVGLGFSWAWFDWGYNRIHIDHHRVRTFHRPPIRQAPGVSATYWQHDPRHRRGVAYRDRDVIERFGRRPGWVAPARPEVRGNPPLRRPPAVRQGTGAPVTTPGRERIERTPRRETPSSGSGISERKADQRGSEGLGSGRPGMPPVRQPRTAPAVKSPAAAPAPPAATSPPATTPPPVATPPAGSVRQPSGGGSFRDSGGGAPLRR